MNVLLVDDSDYKIASIKEVVLGWKPLSKISIARSFQGTIKFLELETPELILLDMTLPTSETSAGQLGGRDRLFGGKELLAEIDFLELHPNVIIVSQYDHFGQKPNGTDLVTLIKELKASFPFLVGGVYYDHGDSKWKEKLREMLEELE